MSSAKLSSMPPALCAPLRPQSTWRGRKTLNPKPLRPGRRLVAFSPFSFAIDALNQCNAISEVLIDLCISTEVVPIGICNLY